LRGKAHFAVKLKPIKIEVVGLEGVQVVQDLSNSVPLIEGKQTYVRAHGKIYGTNEVDFKGYVEMRQTGKTTVQPCQRKLVYGKTLKESRSDWNRSINVPIPLGLCQASR
jgi:hypothetical protein